GGLGRGEGGVSGVERGGWGEQGRAAASARLAHEVAGVGAAAPPPVRFELVANLIDVPHVGGGQGFAHSSVSSLWMTRIASRVRATGGGGSAPRGTRPHKHPPTFPPRPRPPGVPRGRDQPHHLPACPSTR